MARGELYISDRTNLFKLEDGDLEDGNRDSLWHHIGPAHNLWNSMDIDFAGEWWTTIQDGGVPYMLPVQNEQDDNPGQRTQSGGVRGLHAKQVQFAADSPLPAPAGVAPAGCALDAQRNLFCSMQQSSGSDPYVLRAAPADAAWVQAFENNPFPHDANGVDPILPASVSIRQSDQMLAAVAGRGIWLRETAYEGATSHDSMDTSNWTLHLLTDPPGTTITDLQACTWDHQGRLWLWDAGHVRFLRHERTVRSWHAPHTVWTMPERIAGISVNRELIHAIAFDQRRGSWDMDFYDAGPEFDYPQIDGAAYSYAGGNTGSVNLIGGRWVDGNGHVHDIAGG